MNIGGFFFFAKLALYGQMKNYKANCNEVLESTLDR
jgi:hypothetical protein